MEEENKLQKSVPTVHSNAAEIKEQTAEICWAISEGTLDPVQALIYSSKAIKFFEGIKDYAKLVAVGKTDKRDIYYNTKLIQATTPSRYDFDSCGDPVYDRLVKLLEQRKDFLKSLKKPMTIVDEDTGDIVEIQPPIRKEGTQYVKCEVQ